MVFRYDTPIRHVWGGGEVDGPEVSAYIWALWNTRPRLWIAIIWQGLHPRSSGTMPAQSAANSGAARPVIRLPDPLRNWPWPRAVNPHYEVCKEESDAWFESFHAFSPRAQVAFVKCNFSTEESNQDA